MFSKNTDMYMSCRESWKGMTVELDGLKFKKLPFQQFFNIKIHNRMFKNDIVNIDDNVVRSTYHTVVLLWQNTAIALISAM